MQKLLDMQKLLHIAMDPPLITVSPAPVVPDPSRGLAVWSRETRGRVPCKASTRDPGFGRKQTHNSEVYRKSSPRGFESPGVLKGWGALEFPFVGNTEMATCRLYSRPMGVPVSLVMSPAALINFVQVYGQKTLKE